MRVLRNPDDFADLSAPLRQLLEKCLVLWSESGVPYAPDDEYLILIEEGDTPKSLASRIGILQDMADEDFIAPCEWVTDHGCAYEMYIALSDDGTGYSLVLPKAPAMDRRLTKLFADIAD